MLSSRSRHTLLPSPLFSPFCALRAFAFSSLSFFCSGGSSDPCFCAFAHASPQSPFRPMAVNGCELSTVNRFSLTLFPAALPNPPQPIEKTTTLSLVSATLTENTRGVAMQLHRWCLAPPLASFLFFPQRVNVQRTATPATPFPSSVYFTVLWIPGGCSPSHQPIPTDLAYSGNNAPL